MSRETPATILVVEDESSILRGLLDVLAFHGHAPEGVERGDVGLERALAGDHDLAILDVMLPGASGFEICEKLRAEKPELPILMLTARGSEEDILQGFRCGADDYVTKPFSIAELMARVEALLRRAEPRAPEAAAAPFQIGGWNIDPGDLCARRGEREVELTRRELEMLTLFASEAGRIVSRRRLLREVWNYPNPERVETRSVDMAIVKLRRKLAPDDARSSSPIETVRGEGYRVFP